MIHIIHTPAAMLNRQRQAQALRAFALVLPPWLGVMLWAFFTPLISPSGNDDCNFAGIHYIPGGDVTNESPAHPHPRQVSLPAIRPVTVDKPLCPDLPAINHPLLPDLPEAEPDEHPLETDEESLLASPTSKPAQQTVHIRATAAASDLSTPPAYAQCPKPPYPPLLRRQRVQGSVVLSLCVNAEGNPITGEIVQSSGNALLDKHALNWVLNHWRFTPARRNNTPCDARVSTTLHFTL